METNIETDSCLINLTITHIDTHTHIKDIVTYE